MGRFFMSVIHPFRAVRPIVERAHKVASVPYDVVNTEEARTIAAHNPLSFLHVSRPEIDLPDGTNIYSDEVYARAKQNYQQLIDEGTLITEEEPSLYVYRQVMGNHSQVGVVAAFSVDEYDNDLIKKHEKTRKDKEDDRTRHILTLRAQTGPVFLTYRASAAIDALVDEAMKSEPLYDITADDGIRHTVWIANDANKLVEAFASVPALYIADGHHRAASASRSRSALRDENGKHDGSEEYNFFLAVAFPDNQLQILPYNRVVKDLNGQTTDEFLSEVKKVFDVSENANPSPDAPAKWSMYLNGKWYGLTLPTGFEKPSDAVAALDVSILQERVLDPILGIKDVRTDKRIDFVGGIRGTQELEKLVDSGKAAVAFSMFPTTVGDLISVSDAGGIMPPKSTWFEPKLRDALLIHAI
jgi:uncharacterized protein (DUF1015 family)